jgi:hypothetical protein
MADSTKTIQVPPEFWASLGEFMKRSAALAEMCALLCRAVPWACSAL